MPIDSTHPFKRILASVFALIQTRLELVGVELAEEKARWLKILCIGLIAALFGAMALVTFTALIVSAFWETYRWQALTALTFVYLLLAIGCILKIRAIVRNTSLLFASTISEFKKDSELLGKRFKTED